MSHGKPVVGRNGKPGMHLISESPVVKESRAGIILIRKEDLNDQEQYFGLRNSLRGALGHGSGRHSIERLSNRELEVFLLLGKGLDSQEVADSMHVSVKTVETYQGRIKEKLNLKSGRELIQRAAQWLSARS